MIRVRGNGASLVGTEIIILVFISRKYMGCYTLSPSLHDRLCHILVRPPPPPHVIHQKVTNSENENLL